MQVWTAVATGASFLPAAGYNLKAVQETLRLPSITAAAVGRRWDALWT
ncbi:hypothetical protein SAMN04489712_112124 [Thermomonospora echinospora]|uniref:Uncharacterized protein n=1 Tax=Thermomonospora echinospora TaxID=1992 RepID=A0A1H6D0U1_9ACTN|nr:hypothetical protein [Thermomonospora echinospora]SEG78777.1 hypothetical protein SAMN04489712_112124 [Thermomonospora echinospora]